MSEALTFGSTFAGYGGLDLGLERAGLRCSWQVEIEPEARRVLDKQWPAVRRHDDVRTFPPTASEDWHVDVVAGGFPCQDISFAGKGAGIEGERSGLWRSLVEVVGVLRPRYVVLENVAAIFVRGLDAVLGTLASVGYDADWTPLSAAACGLPQARDRAFVVAHADGLGRQAGAGVFDRDVVDRVLEEARELVRLSRFERGRSGRVWALPDAGIHRVADGVPRGVERLKHLGNAVPPPMAYVIGRCLIDFHNRLPRAAGRGDTL